MKYQILKLQFLSAVHFGDGGLATCMNTLPADTVFSALCCEAEKMGDHYLQDLVNQTKEGNLVISDALPFIGKRYYVPKPMYRLPVQKSQDPSERKINKKLTYIPMDRMDDYMDGKINAVEETDYFHDHYGQYYLAQKAAITGLSEAEPYAVELFRFHEGSGLYVCIGYKGEDVLDTVLELFDSLQYTGLGGEVSSGYGRFSVITSGSDANMERRLVDSGWKYYMSLSICLPRDDELDQAMEDASYLLVKRGGFIASCDYDITARKKKDLYLLKSGSVFGRKFEGDVYDVSEGGAHPVYRYAKPLCLGVV